MTSPDRDDLQNPYRATIVDEKPVDVAEFFRAEPQYRKLLPGSIVRTCFAMFMRYKGQFIGLGIAQAIFIVFPVVAVFWLLAQHPDVGREQPWLLAVAAVMLTLLTVFMIVVSISASLRILRKEKMIFLSTPRDAARLAWCVLHTLIYITAWLGFLVVTLVPWNLCLASLGENGIEMSNQQLIFRVIFGVIFFVLWLFALVFILTRLCYGVHFIIDRQQNFLSAFGASWRHTRGNIKAMTVNDQATLGRNFLLVILVVLTGGLGLLIVAGYAYCAGAVTYLMLTGQCELLEEQPDEW